MLTRLTRDVWSFSAAKDYQQMRDLTLALKDENGKLREFEAFKTEAQKICEKYDETWLRTEYDMSVASSQSAARWVQFTKDAKDIPFLEYQTVGDDAVRASHAVLDGIVRNISDSFWSTHYPPNGWGCRCEAIQAPGAHGNKKDMPSDSPVPEMFRTNLAQTGLIYPKNHPYYVGIPKAEIRKSIAYLPPENTYLTVNIGNKTAIDIHPLHGDKELSKNIDACRTLMMHDKKAKLKLLPIIQEHDKAIKPNFYPKDYIKKYPNKNGDVIYKNEVVEFESPSGSKKSIQHAVGHGIVQADKVIIHLPEGIDIDYAYNTVNGHVLAHYPDIKNEIWLMNSTELRQYKRQKRQ
jgi:SPP1 gp7 family putative phage head morphogenesis protein